ncbi:MAG: SusE domain-containing protein, partial [Bacteroidales bacterium]|nr:SusE domain-containing protein [Bacteroidales bacterium]
MKKSLILAAAFCAVLSFSCQKPETGNTPGGGEDKTPSGKTLSAPVLQADKTAVTLDEATGSAEAIKLSWTSGLSEGDTEPVSYTVYANTEGKDLFTDPQKFEVKKALEKAFTGGELNELATKLGITDEGKIVFGVYAVADKGTYESKLSNTVTVGVTLYKPTFVGPDALYLVGAATPYGWDLSTALELPNDGNNVYKATEVPLRVLPQSLNAGFKLYFSRGEEDTRFVGQDPASENFGDAVIVEEGMPDTQFLPAPAGYTNGIYDIEANLNELKVKITRKGDLPMPQLPDKLYMVGGCFEWAWEAANATTLDKVSDKVYEARDIKMSFGTDQNPLGFKVWLGPDTYSPYFAQADDATKDNVKIQMVEDSEAPQFYPGKLGYEDGTYDISMDFGAMVATFTLKEAAPEFPEKLYLLGGCFTASWTYSEDLVLTL